MSLCIGVMSGTSCDGIDVVLVDFNDSMKLLASVFRPYPESTKQSLLELLHQPHTTLSILSHLDAELGHLYADAVNHLLQQQAVDRSDIGAIGLHGQTVFHDPDHDMANTWQLGSAAITAHQTGIPVVSNFRQLDLAAGGQGAPLAPILHQQLLAHVASTVWVINLGGIANITRLSAGQVIGFDTGPANCLMDEWVLKHQQQPYDAGGQWASQGQVLDGLLQSLLQEPYFHRQPPKSTGRELFNPAWLARHLAGTNHQPVDVQRTLLQLTVESLAMGLAAGNPDEDAFIVCGGGAHNAFLLQQLEQRLQAQVVPSTEWGIPVDDVEATLMAWLADQHLQGQRLDLSAITGTEGAKLYGVLQMPA
ncbi:anhydro-N-acetylmuramic acid kinase [Marinicella meishanensis]|uniref:anhydro-N-acetylmuramic acid kinase n=1 Tax=Marinicella meishanensis TaxID=2873263 RepID=UPI001CC1B345|nr:anhydro-N-acetylmuramic acid kinase [Marinicella sp. NBU2979]